MKTYTVIGIYADNMQRYAESFKAKTAEEAEDKAQRQARKAEGTELLIAGTILGDVQMAS